MFRAVFEGCGYKCEKLPGPGKSRVQDRQGSSQITASAKPRPITGSACLGQYPWPRTRKARASSRQDIVDNSLPSPPGSCGPLALWDVNEASIASPWRKGPVRGFPAPSCSRQETAIKRPRRATAGLKLPVRFGEYGHAQCIERWANNQRHTSTRSAPFEVCSAEGKRTDRAAFDEAGRYG